eukprot:scaffold2761_cov391-Prasinococcus_capsulatus_cf.AAC.2
MSGAAHRAGRPQTSLSIIDQNHLHSVHPARGSCSAPEGGQPASGAARVRHQMATLHCSAAHGSRAPLCGAAAAPGPAPLSRPRAQQPLCTRASVPDSPTSTVRLVLPTRDEMDGSGRHSRRGRLLPDRAAAAAGNDGRADG